MEITESIKKRLIEISNEQNITILYACESGSRAWGFESPDSDYDIRFIYKRPVKDYFTLKDVADTLEFPIQDNLDFSGWDLKKFLLHLNKSNGVMFEWLQSPIIYLDNNGFEKKYSEIMVNCFDPRSTINHYLGLTKRTLLDFGDAEQVKIKKYFYILRPLLAALWIKEKGAIPPMQFEQLLTGLQLPKEMLKTIADLKQSKMLAAETDKIPRIKTLEHFVNTAIQSCESALPVSTRNVHSVDMINSIYQNEMLGNC
jgi:predicted nucleotidyltransferase